MSIVLGMASVRAQEIPDSVKVTIPEAVTAACDTVKVALDSLGVTAAADSLRAVADPKAANQPGKDQPADTDAAKDGDGKQDDAAVKEEDGTAKKGSKELQEQTAAGEEEVKEKEKASKRSHAGLLYVALQGGPVFNYYENSFVYSENGQTGKMFTAQGAVSIGLDFSDALGVRLQAAYGNDAGASNTRETSARGFYPYNFQHANLFFDAMLNVAGINEKETSFRPKLYLGAGLAYTFGFTDPGHPWQKLTSPNVTFGFRTGLLTEYCWDSGFGIFADICAEAYTDQYNGLQPSEADQSMGAGYAGFPFDLRGLASLGVVFHF